tara:strand:- start:1944 stop:2759 length:816 start_codon:yes stop_codon:yes gene_type:complete
MKIIIFTYDRFDTITTSRYFKGIKHTVLCHTNQQKQKFINAGNIYGDIIATNQPKGLSNNRNFALDMLNDDEWALFMVDDLINMTFLQTYYKQKLNNLDIDFKNVPEYRKLFKQQLNPQQFLEICNETIEHAEQKGFALCGFSLTDNPLFRNKKYSYWSLADGRCWLVKKTDLRFDLKVQLIDDTCFTALNLKKFGGVVNNNWILPNCKRYTTGAYGTLNQRMKQKKIECEYLVKTYPEFIKISKKSGWEYGTHVKIRQKRKYNPKQINLF